MIELKYTDIMTYEVQCRNICNCRHATVMRLNSPCQGNLYVGADRIFHSTRVANNVVIDLVRNLVPAYHTLYPVFILVL